MAYLHPTCPPWSLLAWPPLLWQVELGMPSRMRHLGTRITQTGDVVVDSAGQTFWGGRTEDGSAGFAWDWIRMPMGIVAMVDPLAVVTNLRLLGPAGNRLDPIQAACHIIGLLNGLPWQHEVEKALSKDFRAREAA